FATFVNRCLYDRFTCPPMAVVPSTMLASAVTNAGNAVPTADTSPELNVAGSAWSLLMPNGQYPFGFPPRYRRLIRYCRLKAICFGSVGPSRRPAVDPSHAPELPA